MLERKKNPVGAHSYRVVDHQTNELVLFVHYNEFQPVIRLDLQDVLYSDDTDKTID